VLIEGPRRFDGVRVIGVDEHCWRRTRRGDRYVTVIIDLTPIRDGTGPARLLDMVEGRSKQVFKTWLGERDTSWRDCVEVVAMDGFTGSRTATSEELPDAVAVMDPFHVVRLAGDALDQCRRRVQQVTCGHRGRKDDPLYAARRTLHTGTEEPVSLQTMFKVLRDRYYCGYLTYKGVEYKGRHEPLITEELFERTQKALDTHSGTGIRHRCHPHYLKGTVWCNRRKRRFVVQRAKGRHGGVYFYFFCTGRRDHICDHPYIPVEVMEQAVINHYTRIGLPETFRTLVRSIINEAAASNSKLSDDMRKKIADNLADLDKKENYFLDLAAEDGWPKDQLRAKLDAIRDDRKRIQRTLEHAENQLDHGIKFLTVALDLMTDPQAMYQAGSEAVRTILNRTIFAKLYVDGDIITGHELREPFTLLAEAYSLWQGYPHQTDTAPDERPSRSTGPRSALHTALPTQRSSAAPDTGHGATNHSSASPALALAGQGSNKTPMVELRGIEPLTFSMRTRRATNCATAPAVRAEFSSGRRLLADRPTVGRFEGRLQLVERRVFIVEVKGYGGVLGHRRCRGRLSRRRRIFPAGSELGGDVIGCGTAGSRPGRSRGPTPSHLVLDTHLPAQITKVADQRQIQRRVHPPQQA
jgi:hypothetical protein